MQTLFDKPKENSPLAKKDEGNSPLIKGGRGGSSPLSRGAGGILAPLLKGGRGDFTKLSIIILAAIVFGGLIIYEYKKPAYQGGEGKLEHPESDIQIIEVEDGKIVRNIKEGFEVKVPKGWETQKPEKNFVAFYSPELKTLKGEYESDFPTGCKIESSSFSDPEPLEKIKQKIMDDVDPIATIKEHKVTDLKINGFNALRLASDIEEAGFSITTYISKPNSPTFAWFTLFPSSKEREKCITYYNKILNSFKIF